MTAPLRLLFVCNQAAYFMRHWLPRAEAAAHAGMAVTVALPEWPDSQPGVAMDFVKYRLERHSLDPWTNGRSLMSLARVFRQVKPHLVHAATIKPNLLTGLLTIRPNPIPCVLSITGLGAAFTEPRARYAVARGLASWIYRLAAQRSSAVVTVDNEDDAAYLRARGVTGDGLEVTCGAGVDPAEFAVGPEPAAPPVRVVLPARMVWSKGVGVFVEAARRLRADRTPVEMQLVGGIDDSGPDAIPREQLERWDASGAVRWRGFCRDMPEVVRGANVVCLPTLYREGLPRALTEGALAGRSLVASDVPGCRDVVQHERTGLRVPPGDARALADAVARLVDDRLRSHLGQQARALALTRFTSAHVIDRTLGIYERLLGLPRGHLPRVVPEARVA